MFQNAHEFEVSIHLIPYTFYISWKSLKAVFQESRIKSMIRCRVVPGPEFHSGTKSGRFAFT